MPGAAFLRASGSSNHHDLGLFSVGADAPGPEQGRVGLYHLAWQVPNVEDLATARETLLRFGAYTGESDHGATKSIYGKDPDGNEFEIMWLVPRDEWGEHESSAVVAPLDLAREVARFGSR
jgi:catechol-2,3-dioxygenase